MSTRLTEHAAAPAQVAEASGRAPAVTVRALMDKAATVGLARLPPFVATTLLQRLATAVDGATDVPDGAITADSVSLHFDGTFSVQGSGGAARDVVALAALYEVLAGPADGDLDEVLRAARRGEIDRPLTLAQRLGHWLVRQRQLPSALDLHVALLAWLWPERAPQAVPSALADYFESERAVVPAALSQPRLPMTRDGRMTMRAKFFSGAALVLFVFLATLVAAWTEHDVDPGAMAPLSEVPRKILAARPPYQRPPPPAVPVALPETPAPVQEELPRYAQTVPNRITLRPSVHGVDVTKSGLLRTPKKSPWSVRTAPAQNWNHLPDYASLYAAEFDAQGNWLKVTQVDAAWKALQGTSARFFLVQPDNRPDEGSFDLMVAEGVDARRKPATRVPDVFTDVVVQQEGRRFMLDELDARKSYVVTLRKSPEATAPVIVSATLPRFGRGPVPFHAKGPFRQTLLTPGASVTVTGVTRLSFVMLVAPGLPTRDAEVVVQRKDDRETQRNETATAHYRRGEEAIMRGDYPTAIAELEKCTNLDPGSEVCRDLLSQSRRMWELQMQ